MKKQSTTSTSPYTNVVSFLVAIPICTIIWILVKIFWPTLLFSAKVAFKLLRKGLTRSKFAKRSTQLPTPDIFKNAPNLARAKSVRF